MYLLGVYEDKSSIFRIFWYSVYVDIVNIALQHKANFWHDVVFRKTLRVDFLVLRTSHVIWLSAAGNTESLRYGNIYLHPGMTHCFENWPITFPVEGPTDPSSLLAI